MEIKDKIEIGKYLIPADFKCLSKDFLKSLRDLDFNTRVEAVFCRLCDKKERFKDFSIFPEVYSFDESICGIDLTQGETATYLDYIFDAENLTSKIISLIAIFTASYLDIVDSGIISIFEKVNFAVPSNDGIFLLSLYLSKKIGLPINMILVGCQTNVNESIKGVYFEQYIESYLEEIIGVFYDEYGMALDCISAEGVIALDGYYEKYDDANLTVLLNVASPYLFSRKVLYAITGEKELSYEKAINKLFLETSEEVPNSITSKIIEPFYKNFVEISINDAINLIKGLSKV
ncbi:MAG: hypothetical protein J6Q38_03380 [Clostridia bacterium]|nr:hypothetical protein [Clostridia bacterium]